jgi:hypothetical protein
VDLAASQSLNDLFSSIFTATTPVPTVLLLFAALLIWAAVSRK